MRGFVAIEAGKEVSERLFELVLGMKKKIGATGATYPKEFHITLKFLGEFDDKGELLEKTKAALAASCLGTKKFSLEVRGVGCFPSPKNPRVVFASVEDERLAGLASKLDREMEKLGFANENRKFSGHITLARLKGPATRLSEFLGGYGNLYFGSMPVNRVTLKKSTLTPSGPVYEEVYSVELGGQ